MAKNALTDAGVGRALFTTRFRLSLQAAIMCFWFGAVPGFFAPIIIWSMASDCHTFDVGKNVMIANLFGSGEKSVWRTKTADCQRGVLTAELDDGTYAQRFSSNEMVGLLEKFESGAVDSFKTAKRASVIFGVLGYFSLWFGLRAFGKGSQDNKRIRGAHELVDADELDSMVSSEKGLASKFKVAGVTLPTFSTVMGILMQGAQRSGKSVAMHNLMRQAMKEKRKCVIYDQNGEFFRAYFRPGKDVFFNPALVGSVNWSIFKELKYAFDSDTLAEAFLPPKGGVVSGPGAFFEDAARALFSVIVRRLAERGARNTSDIAKAFLEMPDDEMAHLIEKSVASSAIGGDSKGQRQGVISSIAIYLQGIQAVQPGDWSVREFIDNDDDTRLFLLGTEDTKAMFTPLFRLIIAVAFSAIAAKQEVVRRDKYWFFLDEINQLGDVKVDEKLATLGKFGVAIVAGIQSDSQFVSSLGRERAETVMNCFNTVLMLLANEPNMQKRMADRIGKIEMDTVNRNQALAVTEWRDGAGLNRSEHEKWTVMPSEFGTLAPLTGFIKLAGQFPVAKVDYRSWLKTRMFGLIQSEVSRNAEIQPTPERDPRFKIYAEGSEDALKTLREEVLAKKGEIVDEDGVITTPKTSGGHQKTTEARFEEGSDGAMPVDVVQALELSEQSGERTKVSEKKVDNSNLTDLSISNILSPD